MVARYQSSTGMPYRTPPYEGLSPDAEKWPYDIPATPSRVLRKPNNVLCDGPLWYSYTRRGANESHTHYTSNSEG